MFIQFRGCGHREFFMPQRSAHVRQMDGICYKCKRQQRLLNSLVTVEKRRRLFVVVEEKATTILRRK